MIKYSSDDLLNNATNLTSVASSIENRITSLNAKYGSLYSKVKSRGNISDGILKLRDGTNMLRRVSLAMKRLVVDMNDATDDNLSLLSPTDTLSFQTSSTTRKLEGEELEQFISDYHLANLDTLTVEVGTETYNGVPFRVYKVIDHANFDDKVYQKFIDDARDYIEVIPTHVLEYAQSHGVDIVFSSDYTVDDWSYDDGVFNIENTYWGVAEFNTTAYGINVITNPGSDQEDYEYNLQSIVHEIGHAIDFSVLSDEGTRITDKSYNGAFGNFYDIAKKEHTVDYDYNFSYYSREDLVTDDSSSEFFAEVFNSYYNKNSSVTERYRILMPDSFSYMDNLIDSIK